jgi:phenylalanyl-tRNA synthetase beta chain
MKNRLEKVGVRSINNVVDVTNYVMMERGQPLHAFDFDFLEEGRIVVRRAKEGEVFVTLDGVERRLNSQVLMICDGVKPVGIAGIMGGLNSEIRENTRTVLLESAYFNPMGNRRAAIALGLETEASYRFGRGIDHGGALSAANRAAELIQALAGGKTIEGVIDAYPTPIPPRSILLSVPKTNQILGTEITEEVVQAHLEALELRVEREDSRLLRVVPPSFRGDLEREIDLVEEIARMDGYEKIPVTLPKGPPAVSSEEKSKSSIAEKRVVDVLLHHGYHEVINTSFTSPMSLEALALAANDPRRRLLAIVNPLSEDLAVMRTSLIPGLMATARYNMAWKNSNLRIFELKRVFLSQEGEKLPMERKVLTGLATGFDRDPEWGSLPRLVDFYDVKGCIEDLLETLQIQEARFDRAEDIPYLHPGKTLRVFVGGKVLGVLGEVHPRAMDQYEIPGKAYLFEMDFQEMVKRMQEKRQWMPLPKFPVVYRDLSLVIDDGVEVGKVIVTIQDLHHPLIDDVNLFDVYRGAPIPAGKKGVSYRIRYQSNDRTLTDEEVNQHHEKVITRLREAFQAELRA